MKADRVAQAASRAIEAARADAAFRESQEAIAVEYEFDTKKILFLVGGVAIVISGLVIWKYAPDIKRKWDDSVAPRLTALKERVIDGQVDTDPADEDRDSSE